MRLVRAPPALATEAVRSSMLAGGIVPQCAAIVEERRVKYIMGLRPTASPRCSFRALCSIATWPACSSRWRWRQRVRGTFYRSHWAFGLLGSYDAVPGPRGLANHPSEYA